MAENYSANLEFPNMMRPENYIVKSKQGYQTVAEMAEKSCYKFRNKIAIQIKVDNIYQKYTYGELWNSILNVSKGLIKNGFAPGEKAAVCSENRPEWYMAYLGIAEAGGTVVPIDAQSSTNEVEYILNHSGAKILFASKKVLENVSDILDNIKGLEKLICFDTGGEDNENTITFSEFLRTVKELKPHRLYKSTPGDILSILYTSGTTGIAKGVMLTHKNVISDVELSSQMIAIDETDTLLSVLPLHHAFECTAGFLLPLYNGSTVTFAESLKSKSIINNIRETGVTVMIGVPLLYEKLYTGLTKSIREKSFPLKLLFESGMSIVNLTRVLINKKIGRAVFFGILEKAGIASIKFFISGGGPLRADVAEAFDNLGITIIQGYGLTEASPVVSVSTEKYTNYYSVGLPLPEVEIKIDAPKSDGIGEIILRSPIVMKGYYKNPEATAETLKNGWLYTGDLGYIDKDGFLFITGRKKNVIVTSGGKNVYPEEIEFKLNSSEFIAESMVYGMPVSEKDKGEKIYAIIVPNYEMINLYNTNETSDIEHEIQEITSREIKKINSVLPAYKKISGFKIHSEELIKTSTKKIKRYLYLEKLISTSSKKKNLR